MLERLSDERLAGLTTTATEANKYANAKVEMEAADVLALVDEVADHRTDAREGATAFTNLHDWLLEWAASDAGAKAAWHAWYDSMARQHRDVSRHQAKFEILDPPDQVLHGLIAKAIIQAALDSIGNGRDSHE